MPVVVTLLVGFKHVVVLFVYSGMAWMMQIKVF